MPREARIDARGALLRIIIGGIERKTVAISAVTESKAVSLGSKLSEKGKIQKQILGN
jgi:hypothetical protein